MRHTLAWSGGKDSTGSLILARERGLPLDEVVTCMPDPFKAEEEFKKHVETWSSIPIRVLPGPSFEDYFFRVKQRGRHKGTIYGWPMTAYRSCARIMKWEPMKLYEAEEDTTWIVGIAADEARRLRQLDDKHRSYLAEADYCQQDARELCEARGLLNPLYDHFRRLGCVRCPKQGYDALRVVQKLEPEKWQWCLDNDHLSPVDFKPQGITFRMVAERLALGCQQRFTYSGS